VWQRRVGQAERLLLATDASIETIARTCGFADANYFAKAFRRANGTTPTEFRSARLDRINR
jgi:AraC-like DNA-binding protein